MTAEPSTPAPAPRRRWRTWRRWLIVALLCFLGYGAWRDYDFRAAIKEAKALGWEWTCDEPVEVIQKDWQAAFRKATWFDGKRDLVIPMAGELERHGRLLYRLAPRRLACNAGSGLRDLSALKGLAGLEALYLTDCTGLMNVDGLKGVSGLQSLQLIGCTGLTNVDALEGLSVLQWLNLANCTGLKNVHGLKGLSGLRTLHLIHCTGLTNVDALKGLSGLQRLDLSVCRGLTNVDGLKSLAGLQSIALRGCTSLPPEAIAALRAALPNTHVSAD